jgi:hypothetical protein
MGWATHVAGFEEIWGAQKDLAGKCEAKKTLEIQRHRQGDNIKTGLQESVSYMDWTHLAWESDQ